MGKMNWDNSLWLLIGPLSNLEVARVEVDDAKQSLKKLWA
jgi:hypothetical protein